MVTELVQAPNRTPAPNTEPNRANRTEQKFSLKEFAQKFVPGKKEPNASTEHRTERTKQRIGHRTKTAVHRTARANSVEFASLVWLETALQWVENLIHILTPRLLVIGFVLSMVDLLTHGNLLAFPAMLYIWAIVQAMAVDATLPNMWRLAFTRFDEKRWVSGGILLLIGIALGIVVFAALAIQFLQQSDNVTLEQAMSKLYLSPELLTYIRSASVVFLAAVLSVLNRTKVTAYRTVNASEQRTENRTADERTEPNARTSEPSARMNTEQNTEPLAIPQTGGQQTANKQLRIVRSQDEPNARTSEPNTEQKPSKQQLIWQHLESEPNTRVSELVTRFGVSKSYASEQKTRFDEQRV